MRACDAGLTHEGGEPGCAEPCNRAILDNPDVIAAAVTGDGETKRVR